MSMTADETRRQSGKGRSQKKAVRLTQPAQRAAVVRESKETRMAKIGARLREARKSRGLSQIDIAEACDVTRASVSLWESGRTLADDERLEKAAAKLFVDVDWLIYGKGDSPQAVADPALRREIRRSRSDVIKTSHHGQPVYFQGNGIPEMKNGVGSGVPYNGEESEAHAWWMVPRNMLQNLRAEINQLKAFPVLTDTLAPEIARGSVVFCDEQQTQPVDDAIFVISNGLSVILKRLHVNHADLTHVGISDRAKEIVQVPVKKLKVIGRVVAQFSLL